MKTRLPDHCTKDLLVSVIWRITSTIGSVHTYFTSSSPSRCSILEHLSSFIHSDILTDLNHRVIWAIWSPRCIRHATQKRHSSFPVPFCHFACYSICGHSKRWCEEKCIYNLGHRSKSRRPNSINVPGGPSSGNSSADMGDLWLTNDDSMGLHLCTILYAHKWLRIQKLYRPLRSISILESRPWKKQLSLAPFPAGSPSKIWRTNQIWNTSRLLSLIKTASLSWVWPLWVVPDPSIKIFCYHYQNGT